MDTSPTTTGSTGLPMLGILRGLLLLEAAAMLAATIFLSMLAAGVESFLGDGSGETTIRFAAGGTFIFAILAAFASRGVRRRRGSAWTLAAMLQVVMAVGTGVAILVSEWHPVFLVGFALPTLVMLVLSSSVVRRELGQG
jgi:peptidoglycan/LPS O-acetylase OafA/YrhL